MEPDRAGTSTIGNEPAAVMDRASKVFDSGDGVHEVSLEIPSGSIFGFIGPSGSGKTTTVRMLTSILEPTAGSLKVLGETPAAFTSRTRSVGSDTCRSVRSCTRSSPFGRT